jgi:small subunit ribosomal protein S4
MARPKARIMRRFGEAFTHSPKYHRILAKRSNPPGQHGARRRKQLGAYGQRLFEKQKLKAFYDLPEKQMRRYMEEASRKKGPTGTNLLQLLERRLDNVVYRLGFTPTIWAAKQLVGHGHVRVNGKRVNIPSYLVNANDIISLSDKMKGNDLVVQSLANRGPGMIPPYLLLDRDQVSGTFLRDPYREEIPVNINENLIVEFYAR